MLDGQRWKELDENWFADFVNFKVSVVGGFEILGKWFPMGGRKNFRVYDGCCSFCIKEGNDLKQFCIGGQTDLDL